MGVGECTDHVTIRIHATVQIPHHVRRFPVHTTYGKCGVQVLLKILAPPDIFKPAVFLILGDHKSPRGGIWGDTEA